MSIVQGYFKQLWYKWRSLRLPWRKQFLMGADLAGNTFWEFKDALNSNRFRRIVRYSPKTHYGDVKISPQWHQWLRHTREDAPTIQEQQYDVSRQAMMKQLAAEADERWRSVPSYLDAPNKQQPQPAIGVNDPGGYVQRPELHESEDVKNAVDHPQHVAEASEHRLADGERSSGATKGKEESPWQRPQRGAPNENWQPQAWTPGVVQRR